MPDDDDAQPGDTVITCAGGMDLPVIGATSGE
jgi:hypothetical protein